MSFMLAEKRSPAIAHGRVPSLPPPPLAPALASPPPLRVISQPVSARSSESSSSPTPRRTFDGELLRPYIRRSFNRLAGSTWLRDGDRAKEWAREIGEEVKKRMMELEPSGYKFIVSCSIAERGSGGAGHLSSFWDKHSDVAVSETFTNNDLYCNVLAVAIRY